MAVVGSTTAVIATVPYTPPFQYYTSTAITYIGGPTTVASGITSATRTAGGGATPTNTGPVDPTVPPRANDWDYVDTYLGIHSLSSPSYRYAYLLWFVLLAFALMFAIAHQLHLKSGVLGAAFSKRTMRRRVIRGKRNAESAVQEAKQKPARSLVLPNNGQLFSMALLMILAAAAAVVGDDYIRPTTSVWNLGTSFKRALEGRANVVTYQTPAYNINKAFWTSGGRFGLIAFALMPLVILFALKAPPFAIFSLRWFTEIYADKLSLLHRWSGRIVWLFTTVHVVLWSIQLFKDGRGDGSGRNVWVVVWVYTKFIWGVVGYAGMTALIAFSMKSIRQRFYELFYFLHVFLVIVTLLGSAMHYPTLWYWIGAAALLWVGERIFRLVRFGWINGWFGGLHREIPLVAGPKFDTDAWEYDGETDQVHGMREVNPRMPSSGSHSNLVNYDADNALLQQYAKPLPRAPGPGHVPLGSMDSEFGARSGGLSYHDVGTYGGSPYSTYGSEQTRNPSEGYFGERYEDAPDPSYPTQDQRRHSETPMTEKAHYEAPTGGPSTYTHVRQTSAPTAKPPAVVIPAGYAYAQLMPSRTVRLTMRVPRPFSWHPGQHVLLFVPEISRFQSHPFSILNTWEEDQETEIVMLIKARKGFTAKLYEETRRRVFAAGGMEVNKKARQSVTSMASMGAFPAPPPILFRTLVDGPYGSAARARPGQHPSIMIVCGGSGVSFGISCLTYICECMASRDSGLGRGGKGGRNFVTKRVRFVWIVREFAEIAWVAVMLKTCMDMVSKDALQVDIFVTDKVRQAPLSVYADAEQYGQLGNLAPPKPRFAQTSSDLPRRSSSDSLNSALSQDVRDSSEFLRDEETPHSPPSWGSVIDLTNYEDEEDVEQTPAQLALSANLMKEGKVRRARSRRAAAGKGSLSGTQDYQQRPSYPPVPAPRPTSGHTSSPSTDYTYVNPSGSRALTPNPAPNARRPSHSGQSLGPPTAYHDPFASGSGSPFPGYATRQSVASSLNDSAYRFDPYGQESYGGGMSPAPSVQGYDYEVKSITGDSLRPFATRGGVGSRADSMVLLESDGPGDGGLWLDVADHSAMGVVAEMARPGRPKLDAILQEEIARSLGSVGVGTCGPASLNAVVRNTVSDNISISKIMHGDRRGVVALFSEDYES